MAAEHAQLSKREILERERRWARPVAFAVIASAALFVTAVIVGSGLTNDPDETGRFLTEFQEASGSQLIASILFTISVSLVAAPVFFLFQAADARSERMRTALIGVTVAGPLFLGASFVAGWIAFDGAAADFAIGAGDATEPPNDRADELIDDQGATGVNEGLQLAGSLGIVVGVAYTALHAMRVGLLTRFWGTLGVAMGVSILLFGATLWAFLFVLGAGFMIGTWVRGRPPAWETGEGMPWPKGGQPQREPPPEEEPGLPEGFGDRPEEADQQIADEAGDASPRKRKRRR